MLFLGTSRTSKVSIRRASSQHPTPLPFKTYGRKMFLAAPFHVIARCATLPYREQDSS